MGGDIGIKKMPEQDQSINRIALGTAQFGMHYGIVNRDGQVTQKEAEKILKIAWTTGMDTLDTAMLYGDSEQILGQIGISDWRTVTKLPPVPKDCPSLPNWVERTVEESLNRLKISYLYGLLLHRSDELLGVQGASLYSTLQYLKVRGLVKKIGVSIYRPEELDALMPRFSFDLIQVPLNILDRRMITSGWLIRMHKEDVEVHARSIFLQGLLLMEHDARPKPFKRWQPLWNIWRQWLQDTQISPLQACVGFALEQTDIDRVIVGVDNIRHLEEILSAAKMHIPIVPPTGITCEDPDLINPSRWSAL